MFAMNKKIVGLLALFFAADATAGLSSSQPFVFYDANGNKVGTGTAYTRSVGMSPETNTNKQPSMPAPAVTANSAAPAATSAAEDPLPASPADQSSERPAER